MFKASLFIALFSLAALVAGTNPGNPCSVANGGCGPNAACFPGNPGVQCVCNNGYFKDANNVCAAVNACATNNGGCHAHATCSTTLGTWQVTCECVAPWYGAGGYYCQLPPVDLCATNNGGCGTNAACYGGLGPAVTCVCNNGYYKCATGECLAINACATNNGGCSEHATCATTLATWDVTCTCVTPYEGEGHYCAIPQQSNTGGQQGGNQGGANNGGENGNPAGSNWDCPPQPYASFWDWRYPQPTCESLTVVYPADLPDGQSNDVNVRIHTDVGDFTLNFHNNVACWTGVTEFEFKTHPSFPAGVTHYSVVWVQVGGTNCHWHGDVECGPEPEDTPEVPGETPPFTWEWTYPTPECDGVHVTYPPNIPSGQANDANVRIVTNLSPNPITLNFHNNNAFWSGPTVFDIVNHPNFPVGVTSYTIQWVQIGGTNYHWTGSVICPV